MKILIIEDEPSLNESMVEYLSTADYVCESVYTFNDAFEKIASFDYDCIVLDIMQHKIKSETSKAKNDDICPAVNTVIFCK